MRCTSRVWSLVLIGAVLLASGCAGMMPAREGAPAAKPEPKVSGESRQLYERALAALEAGRTREAERALLAITGREPNLAGPHANLGILYARIKRPSQAIESLRRAIELNPDRAAYYNELGMVYRREGKFEEAHEAYAHALKADPNYANAHLNIGILYDLYLGDLNKAMVHYQQYRALVPKEEGTVSKWIVDLQHRMRAGDKTRGGKNG